MKIINEILNLLNRVDAKIKRNNLKKTFDEYKYLMSDDHPFYKFPMKLAGDASADPHEFFSHYDAYSFWLSKKIKEMGGVRNILDLGNKKITNASLSLDNNVTALVLKDCEDRMSNVNYVIHDIAKPLNFKDNLFDVFSSSVTLHLVGLGRYGDEINPQSILNFIEELDRVMKNKSDLIFSISYGNNCLTFNEGWKFDMNILKKIFFKWTLVDYLIDNNSSSFVKPYTERYTKDFSLDEWGDGEYRVIFLHFKR
jgi:hypothetical protein